MGLAGVSLVGCIKAISPCVMVKSASEKLFLGPEARARAQRSYHRPRLP